MRTESLLKRTNRTGCGGLQVGRRQSVRNHIQFSSLDLWVEDGAFNVPGGKEEKKILNILF